MTAPTKPRAAEALAARPLCHPEPVSLAALAGIGVALVGLSAAWQRFAGPRE